MNQRNETKHMVDVLFILMLFLLFAFSSISVVGIGIYVYRSIIADMNSNYDSRTAIAYVTEKLREADALEAVRIGELDGYPALILSQYVEDAEYCTYLYACDGNLCELFASASAQLPASAGQKILSLRSFELVQEQENLYSIQMQTATDQTVQLYLTTHSQAALP